MLELTETIFDTNLKTNIELGFTKDALRYIE